MEKINMIDTSRLTPCQIAWVVKDVEKAKIFFKGILGISNL